MTVLVFFDITVSLLPGVYELLDALEARDHVMLSLLTGNITANASLEVRAVNIASGRFVVEAYGSDAAARPALPAIAQARASAKPVNVLARPSRAT